MINVWINDQRKMLNLILCVILRYLTKRLESRPRDF